MRNAGVETQRTARSSVARVSMLVIIQRGPRDAPTEDTPPPRNQVSGLLRARAPACVRACVRGGGALTWFRARRLTLVREEASAREAARGFSV